MIIVLSFQVGLNFLRTIKFTINITTMKTKHRFDFTGKINYYYYY
jgi:hypothetical protein